MVSIASPSSSTRAGTLVLPLYALTLFLSAYLLFFVQPMFAKMVLPRFGGAPAVWNTSMVFFQATLLAGYFYAHLSARLFGLRRQTLLHAAVLLLGLLPLPVAIASGWTSPPSGYEVPWLIGLLAVSVGLPFFAVSATAPLLQQWFAHTNHPAAADPYFLYGASNIGSLLALLSYPVLVEPNIGARSQSWLWTLGYFVLAALIATAATLLWRHYKSETPAIASDDAGLIADVTWRLRARWLLLAMVPSALLLGVTLHIGMEIAAVPFLWVMPLALYLLTFVLVFARRPLFSHKWMLRAQLVIVAAVAGFYVIPQLYVLVGLHVLGMFITAMVCHGELARLRPKAEKLTEFYLWLSIGGVVGGLFAAIVAPLVFNAVYEYPLALVLGLLVRPAVGATFVGRWLGRTRVGAQAACAWTARILPIVLDLALPALFFWILRSGLWVEWRSALWERTIPLLERWNLLSIGNPLAVAFQPILFTIILLVLARRRLRFALSVAAIVYMLTLTGGVDAILHEKVRTFFGVYSVVDIERPVATYRFLYHGRINHGGQIIDQPRRGVTYYTAQGPVGQFFLAHRRNELPLRAVAVTGLGSGALVCQVSPDAERSLTVFEIDPTVERLARQYFQYLEACGENLSVVIGDGRLGMETQPDGKFDMIILDAFAGDAIPAHLLTREAFELYLRKLSDTGWLVVHITNSYVELLPVVSATITELGLVGRSIDWQGGYARDFIYDSMWVIAARAPDYLEAFDRAASQWPWVERPEDPSVRSWTDDFSNLFRALKWNSAGVFAR